MMWQVFNANQYYKSRLAISAALLISACAVTPTFSTASHYQCEQGTELRVVFKETREAKIINGGRNAKHRIEKKVTHAFVTLMDGTEVELSAQKVASGYMFSNGQYTLKGKGNSASWAAGKMVEEQCSLKQ